MSGPVTFLLNDRVTMPASPADTPLLTALREEFRLVGAKPGCREGDCGACTVLVGENTPSGLRYRNVVSCLTPLGNVHGRHVVTVEGLNGEALSPVQQAMVDHGGQQCGYCTPGFVVSLTGFTLSDGPARLDSAIESMDGNICRCTGYSGILRAAGAVIAGLNARGKDEDPLAWAVEAGFVPAYFKTVAQRLEALPAVAATGGAEGLPIVAGGTDAMVRRRWARDGARPPQRAPGGTIECEGDELVLAAGCTGTDMLASAELLTALPGLPGYMRLVASTPIRNMGTIAGNLVNASPIGDYTIMLLALDAQLELAGKTGQRRLPLDAFYLGYKQFDLEPGEQVAAVRFRAPGASTAFNFEKVSKRTHLDIASVNSAALLDIRDGVIHSARVSAGGVAPVPLYLREASGWLAGQPFTEATFEQAGERAQLEIAPISDVRGSERYKRLLLRQLLRAHFHRLAMDTSGSPP